MDAVLAGVQGCFCYIDDILVFAKSVEEHLKILEEIFKRLEAARLLLNSEKVLLLRKSVQFLGHIIEQVGLRPDPAKVEAMVKSPAPRSRRELQRFFGMANWLRAFVKDFGRAASPLHELLRKDVRYEWKPRHDAAFTKLKEMIGQACLLYNPDMSQELILETDASHTGLGAVLLQKRADGVEHPVHFLSRGLSDTETRYSAQERECLAIIWATDRLHQYLVGNPKVVVRTDHKSLQWMFSPSQNNKKIVKWAAKLQVLKPRIEYVKGETNVKADFFSRHVPPGTEEATGEWEVEDVLAATSAQAPIWTDAKELERLQDQDDFCSKIKKMRQKKRDEFAHEMKVSSFHFGQNGVLLADVRYKSPRTVIVAPRALVKEIMQAMHDWPQGGHLGRLKTLERARANFYWPEQKKDVEGHVDNCIKCQERKAYHKPAMPTGELIGHFANDLVALDFMGPFDATRAETVVQALLDHWISIFGAPKRLLSDNGKCFTAGVVADILTLFEAKKIFTTSYHPQGDAVVERMNGTLQAMLSKVTNDNKDDWDLHLSSMCLAHNSSFVAAIETTPFEAMLGRQVPTLIDHLLKPAEGKSPSEFAEELRKNMSDTHAHVAAKQSEKTARLEERNSAIPIPYKVGDLVLLHNPVVPPGQSKKFQRPFSSQRIVKAVLPPNNVELVKPGEDKSEVVNMQRIKLAPAVLQSQRYAEDLKAKSTKSQAVNQNPSEVQGTLPPRRSPRLADQRLRFE
eukprot:m.825160 g.825160  ORF g.825160 m.825160 type:complete len:741 (-) comp59408_c0_seq46:1335-3557(-)